MPKTRRSLKKSAELPTDDPKSEVRCRGLHLDDDVSIVTTTGQQTERPADPAEVHMSMGKIELISNAAAKMMNAAVNCELIGAEVWTLLAKTAMKLFGTSVSRFANKSTNCGIDSTLIIATRTSDRTLDWKRAMHLFSHVISIPMGRKPKLTRCKTKNDNTR